MNTAEATEPTAAEKIDAAMAELGLTVSAVFVPWSQSRNKDEKITAHDGTSTGVPRRSLNWIVTLVQSYERPPLAGSRPILTTDYSAGIAHCPAYKASVAQMGNRDSLMREGAIKYECEHGRAAISHDYANSPSGYMVREIKGAKPILPEARDVIYSLVMDAHVLDASTFEEWASEYGYDTDSRKAEATYRACLDIALKLRNGIGEQGLAKLRDACQDY